MAKLTSLILCDGAVLSFGHWTIVGVTRSLWSEVLPFDARSGLFAGFSDVRQPTQVLLELYDPVARANGETNALKWFDEFVLDGAPERPNPEHFTQATIRNITRGIEHELHVTIAGKLVEVATIDVVA